MRVNFAVLAPERQTYKTFSIPVTVHVWPARGMTGDHSYVTDSHTLFSMLKRKTDLSGYVLELFITELRSRASASLSGVELSDHTLREIGYFVD